MPIAIRTPRSTACLNLGSISPTSTRTFSTAHGGVTPLSTRSSRSISSMIRNVGTSGTSRSSIRSIASSSSPSPWSIDRMPARSAFLIPAAFSACAITPWSPACSASSTITRISSTVYWTASGASISEYTPPVAITLIQSAPARIWRRTTRRTSSTPSAIPSGISTGGTSPVRSMPAGVCRRRGRP